MLVIVAKTGKIALDLRAEYGIYQDCIPLASGQSRPFTGEAEARQWEQDFRAKMAAQPQPSPEPVKPKMDVPTLDYLVAVGMLDKEKRDKVLK